MYTKYGVQPGIRPEGVKQPKDHQPLMVYYSFPTEMLSSTAILSNDLSS